MSRTLPAIVFALTVVALMGGLTGCDDDDNPVTATGDPAAYLAADGLNGGQLYDKFWVTEAGWDASDPNTATFDARGDFFRCKQCHGWDLQGSGGAYISRGPRTSRPNVSSADLRSIAANSTPQQLFDALSRSTGRRPVTADLSTYDPGTNPTVGDQMPDLAAILSTEQRWDLVRFLKLDAVEVSELYGAATTGVYPTGSIAFTDIGRDGNSAAGDAIYSARCASCHGANGAAILVDGDAFTVGSHLRAKPYEDQHKIKFGQLGSAMGGLVTDTTELKDLYKALTDNVKYPDPTTR